MGRQGLENKLRIEYLLKKTTTFRKLAVGWDILVTFKVIRTPPPWYSKVTYEFLSAFTELKFEEIFQNI